MIKACIFDLDGTLLYTLESIARAGNAVLSSFGYPAQPLLDYRYYCGDGADVLVSRILAKADDSNPEHFREGCLINRKVLAENPLYKVVPYTGMTDTLTALKQAGIKLAVCSNKPDDAAHLAIEGAFPKGLFDAVQGQEKGLKRKPSPDEPIAVTEILGVEPEECLYFGDTGTDMKTGLAAGMKTVGVLWGYRTSEELTTCGAQILIKSPTEILKLIPRFR